MASYKVTYFDARGSAELVRLTLAAAGQTFQDVRVGHEEWPKLKPDTPMKALPLLSVNQDGQETTYCQSGASARYVAKKNGLVGASLEEEFLVDEVMEGVVDTSRELYKGYYMSSGEAAAKDRKAFDEVALPKMAEYVLKRMERYGSNGYIIGSKLTVADVAVFNLVDQTTRFHLGHLFDPYPGLKQHSKLVQANKGVAEWMTKRPDTKH